MGGKSLRRTLDERAIVLGLQEIDLGLREAILAEELECGPYHPDGRELPVERDEIHVGVYGIAGDRATEVGRLLR
jgi:hypothetical protein